MCICNGGDAPNVVPAYAKSWYYIRSQTRAGVEDITRRVSNCARGAALATDTKLKITRLTGVYERLENDTLANAVTANMILLDAVKATEADAREVEKLGKKPVFSKGILRDLGHTKRPSSSDEENVSWLAPFMMFRTACVSMDDVSLHHKDFTAQMKLPFAHKGMLKASEIFAATAYDLYTNADLLKNVKKEFQSKTVNFCYSPLISRQLTPGD
jgi:aminobenzoyl-glutamate utilization protein B